MPTALCPKCSGAEVYVSDFAPLQAGEHFLGIYNAQGNNIQLELSLCTNCGFVEISAAKDQLAKLPRLVQTKNWRKKT